MFCKFIQVCVRFVFPMHILGKFKFAWEASPVFQHSCFVSRNNDSKLGIKAHLGQRGGVHLVKYVKWLVVSPSVVDKDFSCGFFRAGHSGNGVPGIVDPLTLAWMKTSKNRDKMHIRSEKRCQCTLLKLFCHSCMHIKLEVSLLSNLHLPQFQHIDHVKVDNIKYFHGLIITHRTEKGPISAD